MPALHCSPEKPAPFRSRLHQYFQRVFFYLHTLCISGDCLVGEAVFCAGTSLPPLPFHLLRWREAISSLGDAVAQVEVLNVQI